MENETNMVGRIVLVSDLGTSCRVLGEVNYPNPMLIVEDEDGKNRSLAHHMYQPSELGDMKVFYPGDKVVIVTKNIIGRVHGIVSEFDFDSQSGVVVANLVKSNQYTFNANSVVDIFASNSAEHTGEKYPQPQEEDSNDMNDKIILIYQGTDDELNLEEGEESLSPQFFDAYMTEPEVVVADSMEEVNERLRDKIESFHIVFGLIDKEPFMIYRPIVVISDVNIDLS